MTSWRFALRGIHTASPRLKQVSQLGFLDKIQALATDIAKRANTVTGYDDIERIKQQIRGVESQISDLKQKVDTNRKNYTSAVTEHSNVQRAINDLLHRKSEWTALDVDKLSKLYKEDHLTEKKLEEAKAQTESQEVALESERVQLAQLIMDRYREEQIWSDKIRQFSTWGTMILMAVNVLLFISVQLFVEPWKRRRLIRQFEEQLNADKVIEETVIAEPVGLNDAYNELKAIFETENDWKHKLNDSWDVLKALSCRIWHHICADRVEASLAVTLGYFWITLWAGYLIAK